MLARQQAKEQGAQEAWFVDPDGTVKEGAATNAWIVTKDGVLVTRPAESGILRGITRTTIFDVAKKLGLKMERGFSVDEARKAKEVFMTAATTVVMPIVAIDGESVAIMPVTTTLSLREAFFDIAEKTPSCNRRVRGLTERYFSCWSKEHLLRLQIFSMTRLLIA